MNSLFRKLFLIYMGTLILIFFILGGALIHVMSTYLINQKKDMLIEQGRKISVAFTHTFYTGGLYDRDAVNREIQFLNEYMDASFFFVNNKFDIKLMSNDIDEKWLNTTLNLDTLKHVASGNVIVTQGNLGNIFKNDVLTIGYPILMDEQFIGAIFMNAPITELQKVKGDVYSMIIVLIFLAAVVGFILIYISTKKICKPLLEMNEIAKIISNGDFERRITVKTQDEIGQLAISFNEMAQSLYSQELLRREFISNISHDLRSPLTSMRGFLQAILDGTIPAEKHHRYLNIVSDETERLAILANNILDANSIADRDYTMDYSDFDINGLIKAIVLKFENAIANKKIKTKVVFAQEKTVVSADYEKVQRIIYNLVDNALKFTSEGGEIQIGTTMTEAKVVIKVKDTGRGIAPEQQKRIFERFYKTDASRGEDKHGSGLGLSIVKEFVKAHGEVITLKSELEVGTEFSFSLALGMQED